METETHHQLRHYLVGILISKKLLQDDTLLPDRLLLGQELAQVELQVADVHLDSLPGLHHGVGLSCGDGLHVG